MRTLRTIPALFASLVLLAACGSESASDRAGSDSGAVATTSTPTTGEAREITVFAAASLRESLKELGGIFTERTGSEVTFNFAGSNELAKQIVAAPSADLFLSAAENWMDTVEAAKRVVAGTRHDLLSNTLVVVGHSAAALAMSEPCALATLDFQNLALGDPESVPAGKYARQWMESIACGGGSLWDAIKAKVAPSPDVRAALGMVMADPKFVGIVYRTDQLAHTAKTKVLFEVKDGPPIRYVLAQISEGDAPAEAREFVELLNGADGRRVFESHGFTMTAAVAAAR